MWTSFDFAAPLSLAFGLVVLLTAWLPLVLRRLPLSLPIIAVGIGYVAYPTSRLVPPADVVFNQRSFEHLTEFVILIALMGSGLRIQRVLTWGRWQAPLRLLAIAMPLTIGCIALLCGTIGGLPWASALLVAAALAPTDPVLAAEIQVGAPGQEEGGEARFSLTSEAGLNDGLAFPFVTLAIALAAAPENFNLGWWLGFELVWKVLCGLCIGVMAGRVFGWFSFKLPHIELSKTGDGLVAVGMTFIAYGITELLHGNGFIAVFVAAITLRAADRSHGFHSDMEGFSEQIERMLMVVVMIIFGGTIAAGALNTLSPADFGIGLIVLLIIRPATAWTSLAGVALPGSARNLVSFFGIRGLGTFYYMAYASGQHFFPQMERLVALTSFVVLASIILHGMSSGPLMFWVDRRRGRTQLRKAGKVERPSED
jgi:NhaP-type Na+/H+ or K+/H+ antiporter